jgi:prophage regulatory protein
MAENSPTDSLALVRKRDLARLLGVDRWTLDNWRRTGRFPQPLKLSEHIVAWRRSDVEAWLEKRRASTRNPVAQSLRTRRAKT